MYKLIAIDMDGTLLNDQKQISAQNIKAISYAKSKGVKIVLATGRPIEGIKPYLKTLDLISDDEYSINFNGGVIYNNLSNEIISSTTISGLELKKLYEVSKKLNANIHAFMLNVGCITPKMSKYTEYETRLNNINATIIDFNDIKDDDKIIKAMFIDEPDYLDNYLNEIPLWITNDYSTAKSAPFFFEMMNKNVDKWQGVKKLADFLNIKDDEIICIGDAGNDLPMIKNAKLGIAMQNSTKDVLQAADFITKDNNSDGVAYAIYKYIK